MTLATALFGVGVKSIQSGTIAIANASSSNTATISSVNTAKSVAFLTGTTAGASNFAEANVGLILTNATTVTAERATNTGGATAYYTVVEFY